MAMWIAAAVFAQVLLKMIFGQWLLNVELYQFQNMYNVEINEYIDEICCCDNDAKCHESLQKFVTSCVTYCDTSFIVSLLECNAFDNSQVSMLTDHLTNNPTTTETNYQFHFILTTFPNEQCTLKVQMNEHDEHFSTEIDTFEIMIPFSSGNQSHVFTGNRGIANITLNYTLVSINRDGCDPSPDPSHYSASDVIGCITTAFLPTSVVTTTVTTAEYYTTTETMSKITTTTEYHTTTKTIPSTITSTEHDIITKTLSITTTWCTVVSAAINKTESVATMLHTTESATTMKTLSPSTESKDNSTTQMSTNNTAPPVAWILVGLFLLLTIVFATISIALTFVIYHGKKGMKTGVSQGMDSSAEGHQMQDISDTAPNQEFLHNVDNSLYHVPTVSKCQHFNNVTTGTQERSFFGNDRSKRESSDRTYATPFPLSQKQ